MDSNDPGKNEKKSSNPTNEPKSKVWKRFVEEWKKEKPSERVMVYLTAVIAVSGLILAGFTLLQMRIYVETTHADLRPYVVLKEISDFSVQNGKFETCSIEFTNVGKTPAYNYFHVSRFITRTVTDNDSAEGAVIAARNRNTGVVIGSNLSDIKYLQSTTKAVLLDSIGVFKKEIPIYLYGFIYYEDTFGKAHRVWYCFVYFPEKRAFMTYSRYNGAD